MILVDTSIWIRYLADRAPYADQLDALLAHDDVMRHDLVYGELLIGDLGGRRRFLAQYRKMRRATSVAHEEVVDFVESRRLHGLGVGWVDVHLMASAIVDGNKVWTADPRFHELARDLGVAFEPI